VRYEQKHNGRRTAEDNRDGPTDNPRVELRCGKVLQTMVGIIELGASGQKKREDEEKKREKKKKTEKKERRRKAKTCGGGG